MPLTDLQIKSFRPEPGKKQRLFDGHGLYLEISPTGGSYWRWKYHFGGKERRRAIGVYPEVSLKDARLHRDEARKRRVTHRQVKLKPSAEKSPSRTVGSHELRHKHFNG
jgi:Arm DNA-binding domain